MTVLVYVRKRTILTLILCRVKRVGSIAIFISYIIASEVGTRLTALRNDVERASERVRSRGTFNLFKVNGTFSRRVRRRRAEEQKTL